MSVVRETAANRVNGFLMVAVEFALIGLNIWQYWKVGDEKRVEIFGFFGATLAVTLLLALLPLGFLTVQPNQARVLVFFGRYIGSVRREGFSWVNPFTSKRKVSLRVHNFNSDRIKVNDALGNPIEIAAVVVWRVVDSAKAVFDVENYEQFVSIQSETAIRTLASRYPYDSNDQAVPSLRGSADEVAEILQREVQARLQVAGVEIMETRLTHLAYAPEIAQAMLRRQQAHAVIAARQLIVEGAVGMVEMALHRLSEQKIVELDEERKATMVNNLLVVLTSEHETQPVINTGTIYG